MNNGGPEPVPDSGLIGSAGRFSGGPAVPRTRINVTKGRRYRFRLISLSAEGGYGFLNLPFLINQALIRFL